jgi:Protein of unknown function (DUF742)
VSDLGARDDEEDDFARPFLTAAMFNTADGEGPVRGAAMPVRDAAVPTGGFIRMDEERNTDEFVRPYLVTGGRVHDGLGDFSTVYALTAWGRVRLESLAFESHQIAEMCNEAQSVAEISAHLRLPLGVVTVLARDLSTAGYLSAASTAIDPASDITLITRLIHAVHAL